MTEEKKLTTAQLAARLKLKPKTLRALLRSISGKATGKRYEFAEKDVPKVRAAIKDTKSGGKKK